jgi:hypothetical protein
LVRDHGAAFIGGAVGKLVFGTHRVSLLLVYVGVLFVAGDLFARANAASIRFIGLVIILMEIAKVAILTGFSLFVRNNFTIEGLTLSVMPRPDLGVIFLALVVLVIAAMINTAVSCYYYFRIVRQMFLEAPGDEECPPLALGAPMRALAPAATTTTAARPLIARGARRP